MLGIYLHTFVFTFIERKIIRKKALIYKCLLLFTENSTKKVLKKFGI